MRNRRFQHAVAMSSVTLPVAAVLSTLLWCAEGVFTLSHIAGWVMTALVAYLWIETNHSNSLIRVRTLSVASVYVLLLGSIFCLHSIQSGGFIAFLMLLSYGLLFNSYGKTDAVFELFHAFLCIGVASLFHVQMILFVPLYFCYSSFFFRSLNWRTFWAAMIGVVLPYWFLWGYRFLHGELDLFVDHFMELTNVLLVTSNVNDLDNVLYITALCFVCFFTFVAMIHCVRTGFNDKVRTRMLLYFIVAQEVVIMLMLLIMPLYKDMWLHLLVMNSAPLLAHYFTLTNSRFSNFLFIAFLLLLFTLMMLNVWMLSAIF